MSGRMVRTPFLNGPPPDGVEYTVLFAIVDGKERRFWKRSSDASNDGRRVSIEPATAAIDLDAASDTHSYSDEAPLGELREAASPVFDHGDSYPEPDQ